MIPANSANDPFRPSFEEVVRTHAAPLRRAALAQLRSTSEADDVLQDTWLAAYRAWPGFRQEAPPGAWLRTILRRQIIDRHRRRKPTVDLSLLAGIAADIPSTESTIDARNSLARLNAGAKDLAGRDLELLERCLLAGDAPTTIARETGATPVTVRVALHRLRHRLAAIAA